MKAARDAGISPCTPAACCTALGVPVFGAHHALADAKATAGVAHALFDIGADASRAAAAEALRLGSPDGKYLAALDEVLEDRRISEAEARNLATVAATIGLDQPTQHQLHLDYLRMLAGGMWDDDQIAGHEKHDLDLVARLLSLSESEITHSIHNAMGGETRRSPSPPATRSCSPATCRWPAASGRIGRAEALGVRIVGEQAFIRMISQLEAGDTPKP